MLAQRRPDEQVYVGPTSVSNVGPTESTTEKLRWPNVVMLSGLYMSSYLNILMICSILFWLPSEKAMDAKLLCYAYWKTGVVPCTNMSMLLQYSWTCQRHSTVFLTIYCSPNYKHMECSSSDAVKLIDSYLSDRSQQIRMG